MSKSPKPKRFEWEPKVGPASILAIVQLLVLIAGGGVLYGVLTTKQDVNTTNTLDLKQSFVQFQKDQQKESTKRDEKLATQNDRITKIETSVGFIDQTVQRIESALKK